MITKMQYSCLQIQFSSSVQAYSIGLSFYLRTSCSWEPVCQMYPFYSTSRGSFYKNNLSQPQLEIFQFKIIVSPTRVSLREGGACEGGGGIKETYQNISIN